MGGSEDFGIDWREWSGEKHALKRGGKHGGRLGAQDQGVSTIETLKKCYPDADFIAYEVGGDSFLSDVKRNCKLLARIFPGIKDYVNEGLAEIEQNIQKIHDKVGCLIQAAAPARKKNPKVLHPNKTDENDNRNNFLSRVALLFLLRIKFQDS